MKDLNYQLMKLCRGNRDGGFSTQATRSRILDLIAKQLQELGFRRMQPKSLKPKHVDALLARWQGHQRRHNEESPIRTSLVGEEGEQTQHHCQRQQYTPDVIKIELPG